MSHDGTQRELTARETSVLRLLAEGATREEIAAALYVGRRAAVTAVEQVYVKLGARNAPHAVHIAWQRGLLGVDVSAASNGGGR